MSFLLRGFLTTALAGSLAFNGLAQTASPTHPAVAAPQTPQAPLLRPNQMTGEKYRDYLNKRYADHKDARAVVHLFNRKHTGGFVWLGTGAGVIGFVASQTGTKTTSSGTSTVEVTPLGWGILLGLFGGVGVGKLTRFNNEKLYAALVNYDQSRSFTGSIMGKLKDKDYR